MSSRRETDPRGAADPWDASWEAAEEDRFERVAAATPEQRLEWLEQALELALAASALPRTADPAGGG